MQLQQQFLAEREVTTYVLRPSAAQRQINSNIYGHHQQIVKDLQSTVFKQFWELLPESDKSSMIFFNIATFIIHIKYPTV